MDESFDHKFIPNHFNRSISWKLTWTVLFSIITIVGVVGNVTVIWIVLAHKRMRKVTNLFLVNLSVADTIVALLYSPFTSFQNIYSYWPFGWSFCKINEAISVTSVGVSILTLCMIAIDRYLAVMHPLKMRLDMTKTIMAIFAIWIVSIVGSAPNWVFTTIKHSSELQDGSPVYSCVQVWPQKDLAQSYTIFIIIVTYVLPLSCMGYTYGRIAAKIWGLKVVGEPNKTQTLNVDSKKKVVKMMIVVMISFAFCWMLFHLYFIVWINTLYQKFDWRLLYLCVFWLAMSNSMFNPIIYYCMNKKFRVGFKKAFRWFAFMNYDKAECNKYL